MVVGIDETRQQDLPGQIDDRIGGGGELFVRSAFPDDAIFRIDAGISQFSALAVHGDEDFGALGQECGHVSARRGENADSGIHYDSDQAERIRTDRLRRTVAYCTPFALRDRSDTIRMKLLTT